MCCVVADFTGRELKAINDQLETMALVESQRRLERNRLIIAHAMEKQTCKDCGNVYEPDDIRTCKDCTCVCCQSCLSDCTACGKTCCDTCSIVDLKDEQPYCYECYESRE